MSSNERIRCNIVNFTVGKIWRSGVYRDTENSTRSRPRAPAIKLRVGVEMAVHLLDAARIVLLHERIPKFLSWRQMSQNRKSLGLKLDGLPGGIGRINDSHKTGDFLKTIDTNSGHISRPHFPGDCQLIRHLHTVAYLTAAFCGNRG